VRERETDGREAEGRRGREWEAEEWEGDRRGIEDGGQKESALLRVQGRERES